VDTLACARVEDRLQRVVPGQPVVAHILGERGELREWPQQIGAGYRGVGVVRGPIERSDVSERIRQPLITISRGAAEHEVATVAEGSILYVVVHFRVLKVFSAVSRVRN